MDVTLTNVEISMFDSIEFAPDGRGLDTVRASENDEVARVLTYSLLSREAVPRHRLAAFDDETGCCAGVVPGAESSDQERIEALIAHDDFLEYLRYFICGPELPQKFVKAFQRELKSASDRRRLLMRMTELARPLADPAASASAFYRLALECNVAREEAREIGRAVAAM